MTERGRILTTHVGSLPRPTEIVELVAAADRGEDVDPEELERALDIAVLDRVQRQLAAGIDIVCDGEMSKIGYATYIRHRLSGFEVGEVPRATPADLDAYPVFRNRLAQSGATARYLRPICRGPITYANLAPLENDLTRLTAALEGESVTGAFMSAPSPGIIALFQPNEYYDSLEAYLNAIGEAMRVEYERIVEAGFTLQIDAPDIAMGRHIMYRDESDDVFLKGAVLQMEVLNNSLVNIPADRLRLHVCWGNYEGPHHLDIEVDKILDLILASKPQTILFEAANPRHAHDWAAWRRADIPDDKVLAPGAIDTTTNYIEHPGLVAERIGRFVDIVGLERVIAATDCGFGTWSGFGPIDPDIGWAKFAALREGADMASHGAQADHEI